MFERFTDRARKVMAWANQEAKRFNHDCIDTEQILLGLMKVGSGVGVIALKHFGVDLRMVRLEVEKRVKSGKDPGIMGRLPPGPSVPRQPMTDL
jgi:ATP-dependent Clp protease ATP-binding subunit ClpC